MSNPDQRFLEYIESSSLPDYGEDVTIFPGEAQALELGSNRELVSTYELDTSVGKFKVGFTFGAKVNYHPAHDSQGEIKRELLEVMNLNPDYLKPDTVHGGDVLIDHNQLGADAIISTERRTLLQTPADCTILVLVDPQSGIYGISHAGRMGVGLNITKNFAEALIRESATKHRKPEVLHAFLAPHIFGGDYPHANDAFMYSNNQPNWWYTNQDRFSPRRDGVYYPDIGPAVIQQLRDTVREFGIPLEVIVSGLNTYQGWGHSNSRDQQVGSDTKKRNLVFVGLAS